MGLRISHRTGSQTVKVERVQAVAVEPGDVIIVKLADGKELTEPEVADITKAFNEEFPDNKVVVTLGLDIYFARPATEES